MQNPPNLLGKLHEASRASTISGVQAALNAKDQLSDEILVIASIGGGHHRPRLSSGVPHLEVTSRLRTARPCLKKQPSGQPPRLCMTSTFSRPSNSPTWPTKPGRPRTIGPTKSSSDVGPARSVETDSRPARSVTTFRPLLRLLPGPGQPRRRCFLPRRPTKQ